MPMIDIYAKGGTFADVHKLAADAAALIKRIEEVPDWLTSTTFAYDDFHSFRF